MSTVNWDDKKKICFFNEMSETVKYFIEQCLKTNHIKSDMEEKHRYSFMPNRNRNHKKYIGDSSL